MEQREKTLQRVFREIPVEEIIKGEISFDNLTVVQMQRIFDAYDRGADETESLNRLKYLKDTIEFELHEEGRPQGKKQGLDVFDLVESFTKDVLVQMNEEIVCRFEKLQQWRSVTNKIGEDLLVAATYARIDYRNGKVRNTFTWKNVIGHNNWQLNTILSEGISENHFHLNGSTPYFDLSWLTLMNCVEESEFVKRLGWIDQELRTSRAYYQSAGQNGSKGYNYSEMHMQAALIRLYLFSRLTGKKIHLRDYRVSWEWLLDYVLKKELGELLHCVRTKETQKCTDTDSNSEKIKWDDFQDEFQVRCPGFAYVYHNSIERMKLSSKELERWQKDLLDCLSSDAEFFRDVFLDFIKEHSCERLELEKCRWMFRCADLEIYEEEWEKQTWDSIKYFLNNTDALLTSRAQLQYVIDILQNFRNREMKDYAMNAAGSWYETNWSNAFMTGERWILYKMMYKRHELKGHVPEKLYNLFYAYLVIKERFRMELVQNNDRVGFINFKKYQARKSWFTTAYTEGELARIATDMVFKNQVIKSLEVRIKPGNTCGENVDIIQRYDHAIDPEVRLRKYYYYVFHFSKRMDDTLGQTTFSSHMIYRHYKLRRQIRKQTLAILQFRKKNPEIAQRLRGIDACSNEDGCRPEVFATAYRVLKKHSSYRGLSLKPEIPQLRATYHVGEVFQDILDGLRAIDEAICFLNLDCGDRLGHATVLGLDANEWYREKNYTFAIRRQDYLDNIVWLYHRLIQYQVPDTDGLTEYLKKQFQLYFSLIYEKALDMDYIEKAFKEACKYDGEYGKDDRDGMNPYEFNINIYYFAWMLRGDHPGLYENGYYKQIRGSVSIWEDYSVNTRYPREHRIRYIPAASILNHYYHYDSTVRDLGNKSIIVTIPAKMAAGIAIVQKKMQQEIACREIAIETNPSSNVQISTFKYYGKHPMLQLYNKGLTYDFEQLNQCAQLNISINTDDQGVFSTSLSNEYALMVSALSQEKDENGEYIYQKAMIYDWIKGIREMGNYQSFMYGNDRNTEKMIHEDQENIRREVNDTEYNRR